MECQTKVVLPFSKKVDQNICSIYQAKLVGKKSLIKSDQIFNSCPDADLPRGQSGGGVPGVLVLFYWRCYESLQVSGLLLRAFQSLYIQRKSCVSILGAKFGSLPAWVGLVFIVHDVYGHGVSSAIQPYANYLC